MRQTTDYVGSARHAVTPDGRYFIVRGRLWRMSDPRLPDAYREALIGQLMTARRTLAIAQRSATSVDRTSIRAEIARIRTALGERGPVWWDDGAPDLNRHVVRKTPYASWYAEIGDDRHAI